MKNKKIKLVVSKKKLLSPETQARLTDIEFSLDLYHASIHTLQLLAKGEINLRKTGCTREIRRYRPTREDERRLPKTVENLRQQVRLLQHEWEVLQRYGR